MGSPVEEEEEGVAKAAGSPVEGRSLVLATGSTAMTGPATAAGEGSSISAGGEGSVTGALASRLSTDGSGCPSPGEEDFWTAGSNFGVSSRGSTHIHARLYNGIRNTTFKNRHFNYSILIITLIV